MTTVEYIYIGSCIINIISIAISLLAMHKATVLENRLAILSLTVSKVVPPILDTRDDRLASQQKQIDILKSERDEQRHTIQGYKDMVETIKVWGDKVNAIMNSKMPAAKKIQKLKELRIE